MTFGTFQTAEERSIKNMHIISPAYSGSYIYKGYFSIVLIVIVNARYEFIMVDTGKNGRILDGGILKQTDF